MRRTIATLLILAAGVGARPAAAAPKGADASALRRACATGALTAYACAQRGVHVDGAETSAPVAAKPAAKPAAAAPAAEPPPSAPAATPAKVRSRPAVEAAGARAIRPFQDTRKRYALEIPEGWELKMQGGFAALAHEADWIQLRSAPAADAARGAAAGLDLLRGEYSQLRTLSDTAVQVGGRPGRRLTLAALSRGGRPSTLTVVAAPMASGEAFVLLAGGAPEEGPAIDAGVSALVRTIRFH